MRSQIASGLRVTWWSRQDRRPTGGRIVPSGIVRSGIVRSGAVRSRPVSPRVALTAVALVGLIGLVGTGCDGSSPAAGNRPSAGTDASGGSGRPTEPDTPAGFDVKAENARPGADCGLARLGEGHAVEGWLDRVGVDPGQPVRLFASTTASRLAVSVFRIGWYGGHTCRLITRREELPGRVQPSAAMNATTNTVSAASWAPTVTFDTATWPPGDYLFRLDSSNGFQSYVPLTVRSPSAQGRIVILNSVTTWQAYNAWGGYSLYHGLRGFADRARVVSFDRPYGYGDGAADFTGNEAPLVTLAERLGLPLAYATDIDLHAEPRLFDGARAVISLGHDEYYSPRMRATLTAARDAGANIAFLGANAVYRRIRLAPTPHGPDRLETGYKVANEDPLYGRDNSQITANWPSPPNADPESSLTGGMYQCNPVHADLVVTNPGHWLLAGTGLAAGSRIPGMIGSEYDRVDPNRPTPQMIEVLAHSPVACHGQADYSDVSYYTAPSGAGVFDAGTSAWVCALLDVCGPGAHGEPVQRFVTQVTTTLLQAFAAGPAGRVHPAARSVPAEARSTPVTGSER
ncbi:hypothetical protein CcI6DRAFT_03418 [Frankia sp. CcI6]|nr:hypothetical protein CcI6DRAFT_03418 [Frankia sp. CcI6]KDA41253.1 hypothetical protein BMG523Draft_03938 [Frankia sp. BMG5.23]KFB03707.1 hypothetical protein ALLO2DRAFT_03511 [Frankia sp. Allo2]OAA22696.1 hypothetical protein AAY23_106147 [Frankia casuarinae]OHV52879.1 hypothetical protein CgIS1_15815 [Frankia sp. CgIS1]